MSDTQIPYGDLERDLARHVSEKVAKALEDVVQLTETPGQALILGQVALVEVVAFTGVAFAVHNGHAQEEVDPHDVGIALLHALKEAGADASAPNAIARDVIRDAELYRAMLEEDANGATAATAVTDAHSVIREIVSYAENIAFAAGVGSLETAGQIVSFLWSRPSLMAEFMAGKLDAVDTGLLDHHNGVLSWHGMDGGIYRPDPSKARFAAPVPEIGGSQTTSRPNEP